MLRLLWLDAGWFGVDQARDLSWGAKIAAAEAFPAAGPVMRGRTLLGATYYYFWAIPFLVSDHPLVAYAFAALLGVVAVGLTFIVARGIAGPTAGLVAAALLATSPLAVIDARVAWAPAALPLLVAAFLLAALRLLVTPTTARAALVGLIAAFGTQLHLAAVPLLLVALGVLVASRRAIGGRGLAWASVGALLPLLPMLWAHRQPLPTPLQGHGAPANPWLARWSDLLLSGMRPLDGLSPPAAVRPVLANLWIYAEGAWLAFVVAVAIWLAVHRSTRELRTVLATLFVSIVAVGLLPTEAWYYYLDTTLVPASVVLGVACARTRAVGGVVAIAAARAAFVVWWVWVNHASGYVSVALDSLRIGGPRPADADGRARILDVRTRELAADGLVHRLGIPLERIWRDVHGAGFSDLDTDNGYFLHRAAETLGPPPKQSSEAVLVLYRESFPSGWTNAFGPSLLAGPLEMIPYSPLVRSEQARLAGCAAGPLPPPIIRDPLAYGSGEFSRPTWPCKDPVIEVPVVRSSATQGGQAPAVRIFARIDGAGRVVFLSADPPGEAVDGRSLPAGAGVGIELRQLPATLRIGLAVEGPATLDVYELHGRPDGAA